MKNNSPMKILNSKVSFFLICIFLSTDVFCCTDIIVGRKASVDGSVITSHTGAAPECRVHVVQAQDWPGGSKAPVYYGLQDASKEFGTYGEIIGYIPQVPHTHKYFHSGYSHMNEFQVAIGESTMSQKSELQVDRETGKQIMTIEQAMVFALQRCKTAREAVILIGNLLDKYGFLPSCGPESEALCIADPNEAWVFEVFSVGKDWEPDKNIPGAIWAAQRVPDDHITIVPNWSIIKELTFVIQQIFWLRKITCRQQLTMVGMTRRIINPLFGKKPIHLFHVNGLSAGSGCFIQPMPQILKTGLIKPAIHHTMGTNPIFNTSSLSPIFHFL